MKTIFITGGATGIGAACIEEFIKRGWNVAFIDINRPAAEALCARLGEPGRVLFIEGSTTCRADIQRAVEQTTARFGGIDSVFANAGIHRKNTLLDISDSELDLMIQTNIYGNVNTLRQVVPHIIARGGGTVVINVSDQWYVGKAASFAYGLTKGALGQITRSLAIDLGPHNIRVNAVCAGSIDTPLVHGVLDSVANRSGRSLDELYREENAMYARGSMGRPDEVAKMVYFLASDESSFCTGGHYLIDGGLVAGR